MKSIGIFFFIIVSLGLTSCVNLFKLVDIRTEQAKLAGDTDKATSLIQEMQLAHGVQHWKDLESYRVHFTDEFYGFVGKQSHPYKEQKVDFELSYIPGTYDGRLKFQSGKLMGTEWGIQSWKSYSKNKGEEIEFKQNKDIIFWVPTYQYFIEFPARISSANVFVYAGEATIEGISCDGVLASWNDSSPQKDVDQYLIWIDKNTKRIVKLEYTVRDAYKFVAGAAIYKDYQDYNGIILPARMPVESNLIKDGLLHEMRINHFEATSNQLEYIRPNKSLEAVGDSKG